MDGEIRGASEIPRNALPHECTKQLQRESAAGDMGEMPTTPIQITYGRKAIEHDTTSHPRVGRPGL